MIKGEKPTNKYIIIAPMVFGTWPFYLVEMIFQHEKFDLDGSHC